MPVLNTTHMLQQLQLISSKLHNTQQAGLHGSASVLREKDEGQDALQAAILVGRYIADHSKEISQGEASPAVVLQLATTLLQHLEGVATPPTSKQRRHAATADDEQALTSALGALYRVDAHRELDVLILKFWKAAVLLLLDQRQERPGSSPDPSIGNRLLLRHPSSTALLIRLVQQFMDTSGINLLIVTDRSINEQQLVLWLAACWACVPAGAAQVAQCWLDGLMLKAPCAQSCTPEALMGLLSGVLEVFQCCWQDELRAASAGGTISGAQLEALGHVYQMLGQSAVRAGLSEEEWCNCWIASVDSTLRSCQSEGAELTLEASGAQIVLAMVALYHDSRQLIHGIIKFYSKADRKDIKLVLRVLQQCYKADPARFLEACSMLLQPDSNCSVDVRTQCLTAMECAVEAQPVGHHAQTLLWSQATLDSLFFSLLQDASVRVRRTGMRVLSMVAVPEGAASAAQLFNVLKLKLQDRDTSVRHAAIELIIQLPQSILEEILKDIAGWRSLFAAGFSHVTTRPKVASAHQQLVQDQLLGVCRSYLKSSIHNGSHPLTVLAQLDLPNCLAAFLKQQTSSGRTAAVAL